MVQCFFLIPNELMINSTPHVALLDYVSAITFVLVPIAWIPLILLFGFLAICDELYRCCKKTDHEGFEKFRHTDFEQEYSPNDSKWININ